ncbi:hypothetical protein [Candidatus Nitrospira neomarina]|uniref:Uncharacterized protein n=1 Tax=Candidatus Nitrospira neomarina TaxID=3020899 RepID=A0AA96GHU2_9BACT|nr:hypothetical protein [Candidatus Nitrospira neomarina]WNM60550.1 hypothetical protein PQG83_12345 [Candidatus Nitrospira neomarina]
MSLSELFKIASTLDSYKEYGSDEINALSEAATNIGKAWSGSWFGYHSRVYYQNFEVPLPGAVFSQEWGLMDSLSRSRGAWQEYRFDDVVTLIYGNASNPSIDKELELANKPQKVF